MTLLEFSVNQSLEQTMKAALVLRDKFKKLQAGTTNTLPP